ncbi:DUF2950 domain-containing protein [Lysobacter sp. MMG2]|uniref:DUF2950 domain-containing protein n=1 Tax=Lysobacter sp. MMG2 TaxID=2801338 RepID=UPI001C24BF88|nr:DUF2950 domain-containing protein [Lysobacter sp. MMG2]MBU8976405.1 DUF2950 domain-containing protein [Lysobacter sp. MMG2]
MIRPIRLPLLVCLAALAWPAQAQQSFPTPDAAAQALVAALGASKADEAKLSAVLGPDWKTYIPVGSVDREDVDAFLKRYRQRHSFQSPSPTRAILVVGPEAWTLPVPLEKGTSGWAFNLKAGEPEIRARRIGRNELDTVQAMLAYHDAQMDYASVDRNGDGVLEYARKFVSTDGKHDGLYWDDKNDEESPLGPLFGDDTPQGEWHGYHFRILEAQGPSAPRGAYSYLLGDHMSRGFALVAWPARYGDSGVMSFIISHDGQVFEQDLGPEGGGIAKAMTKFDPDSGWKEIDSATIASAASPSTP